MSPRPSRAAVALCAARMTSAGRSLIATELTWATGCSLLRAQRTLRWLRQTGYPVGTRQRSSKAGSNPIVWRRA